MNIKAKRSIIHWCIFVFGMFSFTFLIFSRNYHGNNIVLKGIGLLGEILTFAANLSGTIVTEISNSFEWATFTKLSIQALLYWSMGKIIINKFYPVKPEEKSHNEAPFLLKRILCTKIFAYCGFLLCFTYWIIFHNSLRPSTFWGPIFFKTFSIPSYCIYSLWEEFDIYPILWGAYGRYCLFFIMLMFQVAFYTITGWLFAKLIFFRKAPVDIPLKTENQ